MCIRDSFLIFDDGFQNLKFKTTLSLLAVTDADSSQVVFRDFLSAASGADVLVQTKGLQKAPHLNPAFKIDWEPEALPSKPVWLLCALGDPSEVVTFYRNCGVRVDRVVSKGDHAVFDASEVKKLMKEALNQGAIVAVTEKDKVKLPSIEEGELFVLRRKIRSRDWIDFVFERLPSSANMH